MALITSMKNFYKVNEDSEQPLRTKWPYNNNEVLICVDVECHCFNENVLEPDIGLVSSKRRVCEVGFSVLDTQELVNCPPGDRCQNFWGNIHTFSLAIKENVHEKIGQHKEWCKVGCAEDFIFGQTQWVHKQDFKQAFLKIVHSFGASRTQIIVNGADGIIRSNVSDDLKAESMTSERKVIFLMFGVINDMRWLESLHLDLEREFPKAEFVNIQQSDIATMLESHLNKHLISAADLFKHLGVQTHRTHNGGNDSMFEMQAFLAPFAMTKKQWSSLCQGQPLSVLPAMWKRPDLKGLKDLKSAEASLNEKTSIETAPEERQERQDTLKTS